MIVTDVGGNSEAIRDGEQGIVVPARDPARLAEALIRLAGDAELRSRMGAAARRRLQEQFTLERCADAHEKLYRALLAGGSPRVRCAS
jgi:glycosyltransferase involved in cell wall biosynthesis